MTRNVLVLTIALGVVGGFGIAGCGGASRVTAEDRPRASARTRRLPDLLGPLGARLPPEQLAEIAAFIRRWEQDPMAPVPENDTDRSTAFLMLAWLTESPDVAVTITTAVQTMSEGRGADVSPAVTMGSTFGMAAYLIEHPGSDPRSAEVQAAGIESALRWYEAALRRGEGQNGMLEELTVIRDRGELVQWWSEHVTVH